MLDGCGGIDDDCDGMFDEDPDRTYYEDVDGDSYGVVSSTVMRCAAPVGFAVSSGDCNDANFNVHPAAPEVCNGVDDNCDLTPDNPPTGTCTCVDGASDSCGPTTDVGRCAYGTTTCVAGGWTECAGATLPSAEICNGEDDDCDGVADDMDTDIAGSAPTTTGATLYYRDMDGDGAGDSSMSVARCAPLAGHVTTPGDCDDGDSGIKPGAAETCDGVDQNCDGTIDNRPGGCVCIDTTTRPCGTDAGECTVGVETCVAGAWGSCSGIASTTEVCDGTDRDEDCDGQVDEGLRTTYYLDDDGDSYGDDSMTAAACSVPAGHVGRAGDCDDADDEVNPAGIETCDGVDENCDGAIDNRPGGCDCIDTMTRPCGTDTGACTIGVETCISGSWGSCSGIAPATEVCDGTNDEDCDNEVDEGLRTIYYADADADSYGNPGATELACSVPAGHVARPGDCNDGNDDINPVAIEICDTIDNDCDGTIDPGCGCTAGMTRPCGSDVGQCVRGTQTCSIAGEWGTCAGETGPQTEICNTLDDDCDGMTDEMLLSRFWRDGDSDGHGDPTVSTLACTTPSGYVDNALDCNDTTAAARQGNLENTYPCDGLDNDCDGTVDEAGTTEHACYRDFDGDTYGSGPNDPACTCPPGWVTRAGDCDETGARAALIHPGAAYQTIPHCSGDPSSCTYIGTGGGPGCTVCTGSSPTICYCGQRASFDYDCVSGAQPQPAGCCTSGPPCACVAEGRVPTASHTASECGQPVTYGTCCGVLSCGPTCSPGTQPLGCR